MLTKQMRGLLEDKRTAYFLFAIALFILLIPFFYRYMVFEGSLANGIPYHHNYESHQKPLGYFDIFDADNVLENSGTSQDEDALNPYDAFLSAIRYNILPWFSETYLWDFFVPVIFGMLSLLLFYALLSLNKVPDLFKNTILLVLILTPVFIFTFTQSNQYSLLILLSLSAFYLFSKRNLFWLSLLLFSFLSLFDLIFSVTLLLFLWAYSSYRDSPKKFFITVFFMLIFTSLRLFFQFDVGLVDYPVTNMIREFVSDLGGSYGIGVMQVAIFLYGFIVFWVHDRSKYTVKILSLILLLSIFFVDYSIVFLYQFPLAIFSSLALISLLDRKWYSSTLKQITVLIIICGLLFSTMSYAKRMVFDEPYPEQMHGLAWMQENLPEGKVLSAKDYGFLIQSVTGNPVLLYGLEEKDLDDEDIHDLFFSQDLKKTRFLLDRYNISYIWLTDSMQNGSIWYEDDDGLLFLLRNNETFEELYDLDGVEIWKVHINSTLA